MMRPFKPLQPGDTIGVCAPSGSFDPLVFLKGIQTIKQMGFQVHVPEQIDKKKRYLAGDDLHRAGILNAMFNSSDISAVICARGGYGAMRILEQIEWETIRENPKPFIGFSDATALLVTMINRTGIPVIHGPSVVTLGSASEKTCDSLYQNLVGKPSYYKSLNGRTLIKGRASGILMGGNLSTLCHLTGTPFQPVFRDAVVFLEDIAEPPYKIDRMLTQMKMAGAFNHVQGVVLGSFFDCGNVDMIYDIVTEIFQDYDIPVFSGLESGHEDLNLSFHMGSPVILDADHHEILWEGGK